MPLTINIDFAANIARLTENSKEAADAVKRMSDRIDSAVGVAKAALVGLAGAFSIGAITAAVRSSIDFADSLQDLADRAGSTASEMAGLSWAAKLSGTSIDAVAAGSRKLAVNLSENRELFQRLGISTTNQTEALIQLGDVFVGMQDSVQRSNLAIKLFGKSGEELLPLLSQGSARIREMVQEGKELSGVTDDVAARAAAFNDELDRLRLQTQGAAMALATQMLPTLQGVVGELNAGIQSTNGFMDAVTTLGTINPFRSVAGNINAYRAELAELNTARESYAARGFSTAAYDADIEDLTKKLNYLKRLQAEVALSSNDGNQSDAETNRLNRGVSKSNGAAELARGLGGGGGESELAKLRLQQYAKEKDGIESLMASQDALAARYREIDEAKAKEDLQWQQALAVRLAAIQTSNASEVEIERGKLTQIQNDLQFALDQGWLTEDNYRQMREQAEIEHQARLGSIVAQGTLARQKFVQSSSKAQMQTVLNDILMTTQGVAASNREMFEINKVAGIANAIVSTYTGVGKTLAAYPYPWNLPLAALHLAAGLAQVQQIRNARFGSSTSAPSIAGGGATPTISAGDMSQPTTAEAPVIPQVAAAKTQINLTLQGSQFSYEQVVNEIIPLINQAGDNGADIRVVTE